MLYAICNCSRSTILFALTYYSLSTPLVLCVHGSLTETTILPVGLYWCEIGFLALRRAYKLRVSVNKVLRKVSAFKREEMIPDRREFYLWINKSYTVDQNDLTVKGASKLDISESCCNCFDSRSCQIFWEVVGLERGPPSLANIIEEKLGRDSNDSSLQSENSAVGEPPRSSRDSLYPQKLALTSPTIGVRSVDIVRSRTKAT
jgi:hypothetical protein